MTDLTRRKKELLNSYNNLCSCYGDIISEQTKTINQLKELRNNTWDVERVDQAINYLKDNFEVEDDD